MYEPPPDSCAADFLFWIELFDHDSQVSIDGKGCRILEDGVRAAEYLITRAKRLSERSGRAGRKREEPLL